MKGDGPRPAGAARPPAAARAARVLVPHVALAAGLVLPASSLGAVTIGSDLTRDPDPTLNNPMGTCDPECTLSQEQIGSTTVQTPSAGVVVSWRIKTNAAISQLNFRVVRWDPVLVGWKSLHAGGSVSAGGPGTFAFDTRVPVAAGDRVGVDFSAGGGSILKSDNAVPAGSAVRMWRNPKLGPTETRGAEGYMETPPAELFLNATIEPDADRDGYGDESQDLCPTDANRQTACAANEQPPPAPEVTPPPAPEVTPLPAPDVTPPLVRLAGAARQSPLRRRAVRVRVSASEAGPTRATGSISIPGRARAIRLRPASAELVPGVGRELRLRLSRGARTTMARALARRRLRARVTVETRDVAGNLTRSRRTITLTR